VFTDSTTSTRSRPAWLIPVIAVAAVVLLVILPLIGSYNSMVDKRSSVDQSFADLDAQLQRRNDLIPNLVSAVRGALQHEETIFGDITKALGAYSSATTPQQKASADAQIEQSFAGLRPILQLPQLQANANIRDLQTQLEGTENRIAVARRDYNGVVTSYNTSIRHFPRSIVAGLFGFQAKALFKATPSAATPPTVDLNPTTSSTPK
jgi:LemA protein